jgi:hypothetical protein
VHGSTAHSDSSYRNLWRAIRDGIAVILVDGIGSTNHAGGRSVDIEVVAPGQVLYSQLWLYIVGDVMHIKGAVSVDLPEVQTP